RIRLDSQHARPLVADGVHRSSKRAANQAPQYCPSDATRTLGGAYNRHAMGRENRIQRVPFGTQDVMRAIMRQLGFAEFGGRFGGAHDLKCSAFARLAM